MHCDDDDDDDDDNDDKDDDELLFVMVPSLADLFLFLLSFRMFLTFLFFVMFFSSHDLCRMIYLIFTSYIYIKDIMSQGLNLSLKLTYFVRQVM